MDNQFKFVQLIGDGSNDVGYFGLPALQVELGIFENPIFQKVLPFSGRRA